jgi:hypothetical protein
VSVQWYFEDRRGTGVLHLSGHFGRQATDRFAGAMAWARSRTAGTIVVDLSGWSAAGEAAILDAARAPLALCGLRGRAAPLLTGNPPAAIRIYADVEAALSALASR